MSGRRIWMTGASSGIGHAATLELARRGHEVVVSARSEDKLRNLAEEAEGTVHAMPLDVTDGEAARQVVERIERERGEIDVALLAAGTHQPVAAADFTAEGLRKVVEINLMGVANCLEPVMAAMLKRQRGRIAIVSSVAGYRGLPTSAYYGATKAALINMAESLRFDLVKRGVTIQLVDPGFVRTPLTDKNEFSMPFLMEPEDAARRLADGLESDHFEVTFPKRFTWILKALRCLPYALYFPIIAKTTGK
jgi:short-subunit dehydrogenase